MDAWSTVSNLATGVGTLVLAVATFAAVRSGNRSARIAEAAFRQQLRPVLIQSNLDDPRQKIMFQEGRWISVDGGHASIELDGDVVYLVLGLRNVGTGLAVLQSWHCEIRESGPTERPLIDQFRRLSRDLYIPAGGTGLWQGALRDATEELHGTVRQAVRERRVLVVDLLYTDHTGGQSTVSRFSVSPVGDDGWLTGVTRHWSLDQPGPR